MVRGFVIVNLNRVCGLFACIRGNSIVRIVALTEADATQANCKRLSSSARGGGRRKKGVVSAGKLR